MKLPTKFNVRFEHCQFLLLFSPENTWCKIFLLNMMNISHLKKFLLTRFVHATRVWIQIVWINDAVKVLWCCFFFIPLYGTTVSWAELEFRLAHNQWFVICICACLWVCRLCTWIGIVLLHEGTVHFSTAVKFLNHFCFTNKVFVLVFLFSFGNKHRTTNNQNNNDNFYEISTDTMQWMSNKESLK